MKKTTSDTLKCIFVLIVCIYEMAVNQTSFFVPSVFAFASLLGLYYIIRDTIMTDKKKKAEKKFDFFYKPYL